MSTRLLGSLNPRGCFELMLGAVAHLSVVFRGQHDSSVETDRPGSDRSMVSWCDFCTSLAISYVPAIMTM